MFVLAGVVHDEVHLGLRDFIGEGAADADTKVSEDLAEGSVEGGELDGTDEVGQPYC